MKNIQTIPLIILGFIVMLWSCSDADYEQLNRDPNNPTQVDEGHLFVSSIKSLFDQIEESNVNVNIFRLFAQYWTQTTYVDESNYDLTNRAIPGFHWDELYLDVLNDLKNAIALTPNDVFKTSQAEVLSIYTWQVLVDTFGDIPYSEALKAGAVEQDLLPAYDSAAEIYSDLLTRIDAAINNLKSSEGKGYQNDDLIFNNNRSSWLKFAYSLKLKIGIRLSDVNPNVAKSAVETAVSGGVFESNMDNVEIAYEGGTPNTNPIWEDLVQSGRNDYIPANTIVDYLNALEDPRRDIYFNPNSKIDDAYVGGVYGKQSVFKLHSHLGEIFHDPTYKGVLMDYSEVCFHLAEAAAKGWSVGGTAKDFYNAGIRSNMENWEYPQRL